MKLLFGMSKKFNQARFRVMALGIFTLLAGCASSQYSYSPNYPNHSKSKIIGVFFDGTANDETSNTNVARLRNLVYLQPNPDIHTIYVKGVGTAGLVSQKIFGRAVGYGIEEDVKQAFLYLGETYRPNSGDKVFVFGFSRGAYSARVLAGLVEIAGIPDFQAIDQLPISEERKTKKKEALVDDVFSAYRGDKSKEKRKQLVENLSAYAGNESEIEFMGLWDTVPAIGLPDYKEDVQKTPNRYYDQLCNVKKAAHAMSIDDNRSRVFVALTLTSESLIADCPDKDIGSIVEEVWFSGAHSDVGGGYNTDLSGVSLNWMLRQILANTSGLVPPGTQVYEDPLGVSHIPSQWPYIPFGNRNRDWMDYAKAFDYNGGIPKVHYSVVSRIATIPKKTLEFDWDDPQNNDPKHSDGPATACVDLVHIDESPHVGPVNQCTLDSHHIHRVLPGQKCFTVVEQPDPPITP